MPARIAIRILLGEIERIDSQIRRAERMLASGADGERVRAAGELAELKLRAASLERRLDQLKKANDTLIEMLRVAIDVEVRQLAEALERWIEPQR
jgi:hypothetical protein